MARTRLTDAQNTALVKRAIAYAESLATNDADFVQLLRATYFSQHPAMRRQLRVLEDGTRVARSAGTRAIEPSQTIYGDERFVENARALAERTKKNLRIMGGTNVSAKDFPDCVAVGSATRWGCSGTLIAPTVVISAGHCASVATRVYFGSNVKKKGKIVRVAQAVRHPDYNGTKHHDVLLLLLEKPATAAPRKLAATSAISKAKDGRAVGFGHIDPSGSFGYGTKRQVDVPIASPSCSGKVNGKPDVGAYGCDRNLEFVAGKPLLDRDSCSGDSGGPFYIKGSGSSWLLAGATSRSTKGAVRTCGDGGIYVRVDQYREWIEDTAKVKLK